MSGKLAILGAGNMGCAIAVGIIRSGLLSPGDITLVRRNTELLSHYRELGCSISDDSEGAAEKAEAILLCVKPQMMKELFSSIAPFCKNKLVISIAAGIRIETIEGALPAARVVRAMPNTPLTVGQGVTELCRGSAVSDDEFAFAKSIFNTAGYTVECSEEQINALTALTSSAVAYFAEVENAMVSWAMENGLSGFDRRALCDLVSKTAMGTAQLLFETGKEPKALVRAVASPGGTTERALDVFAERDLEGVFYEGMTACLKRAEELSGIK